MRINRIHLENFRCFPNRAFDLAPRATVVIGGNATGKTALLDGLAVGAGSLFLGMPSPARPRGIRREDVRRQFFTHGQTLTSESAFPTRVSCLGHVDGEELQWSRALTSEKGRTTRKQAAELKTVAEKLVGSVRTGDAVPLPLIAFYGTGRLWGHPPARQEKTKNKPAPSRFWGYQDCLDPTCNDKLLLEWFQQQELIALQRQEKIGTLEAVRASILSCIPGATSVFYDISRGDLMVRFESEELLPFGLLSDGFRNMVAVTADIAVRCATLNPFLETAAPSGTSGIVLIDEIDLHLHPKWQRRVLGDLLRTFPRIQFVFTTHSPFIIQSLPSEDGVDLLNLDNPEAEDFHNKSIEDVAEEIQGIDIPQRSERYLKMLAAAEKYFGVLGTAADADAQQTSQLRNRLDELMLPFSDDPAYQAFLKMQRMASGTNGEGV